MKTYSFRIKPGLDLRQEIQKVVEKNSIRAGVILSGVGGLSSIHLRLADAKPDRQDFLTNKGAFEIVSLTGTLSVDGSHLHTSVSDKSGQTYGGHLSEGNIVKYTAEIVIGVLETNFHRELDTDTGFNELVVEDKE